MPIQGYGVCCQINALKPTVRMDRTCTRQSIKIHGPEYAQQLAEQNCADLPQMIRQCAEHNIAALRISSHILPHITDPAVPHLKTGRCRKLLGEAGKLARELGVRLTTHPAQHNCLATLDLKKYEHTLADLTQHAQLMDWLGFHDAPVVVHAGGPLGSGKRGLIRRWIRGWRALPGFVRAKVVLENDERHFSAADCLAVHAECGVAVVFDTHHDAVQRELHPGETLPPPGELLRACLATWPAGRMPKVHISNQMVAARPGAHSVLIESAPAYLLAEDTRPFHLMVEAKGKEEAIYHAWECGALPVPAAGAH